MIKSALTSWMDKRASAGSKVNLGGQDAGSTQENNMLSDNVTDEVIPRPKRSGKMEHIESHPSARVVSAADAATIGFMAKCADRGLSEQEAIKLAQFWQGLGNMPMGQNVMQGLQAQGQSIGGTGPSAQPQPQPAQQGRPQPKPQANPMGTGATALPQPRQQQQPAQSVQPQPQMPMQRQQPRPQMAYNDYVKMMRQRNPLFMT
jgi:hypothetical protein